MRKLSRLAVCTILFLSLPRLSADIGVAEAVVPPKNAAPGELPVVEAPEGMLEGRQHQPAPAEEPPLSPEQQRNRQHQEFAGQWVPFFLYYSDYALFSPFSLERIGTFPEGARLTALATTPAQSSLVYCIAREAESLIFLQRLEDAAPRQILKSADVAADLRFCGPMTLSRDKRWLLVGALRGTQQPMNEVWLIDLTEKRAPECILPSTELVGCSWSPVGTLAACLTYQAKGGSAVVLVDPDSLTAETLVTGEGRIEWSLDGARLAVHLGTGEVITIDARSKRKERSSSASGPALSGQAECSDGFSVVARVARTEHGEGIRIQPRSGVVSGRVVPVPSGVKRLLGWSDGGRLLAYVANDSRLHFCSGALDDAEYERLIGSYPPTPGGVDAEQLIQSARDGMALETRVSPIRMESPDDVLSGWARSSIGPSFVYAEKTGQIWHLNAVQFRAMSVPDLGLDPEADYATQLFELSGLENMETVAQALKSYARDHEGLFPPHPGGADLERELAPYLDYTGRLHAAFSPGQVNIRLLVPNQSMRSLAQQVSRSPGKRIRIAETLPESNRVFAIDAVLLEGYSLGPDTFPYEVIMEYR